MGDFLYNLGTILDQQFNLSENKLRTLDDENGKRYGRLGDFANQFDQSAERKYLEEGYTRHTMLPNAYEVMMQEPNITVLVKKKQFSSLRPQQNWEYMDKQDRLFLKSSAVLFNNKCMQISAYERLSKIERIAQIEDNVDLGILPILLDTVDGIDAIGGLFTGGKSIYSDKFRGALDKIRKVVAYNRLNATTTWMVDKSNPFKNTFGEGTGVIELTAVTGITCTNSLVWRGGQFSLNLEDPHGLMRITELDIEKAISDALNPIYNSRFFNLGAESLQDTIELTKGTLNARRRFRRVNEIKFEINRSAFLGKRVTVLIDGIGEEVPIDTDVANRDVLSFITGEAATVDEGIKKGGRLGDQGLDDTEIGLVTEIVNGYFSLLSLQTNSLKRIRKFNGDTNYLRSKMNLSYGGKAIIQPMDVVHIYIDSKTRVDNKVIGGLRNLFTGFGFLQNFSSKLEGIREATNTLFHPNSDTTRTERETFVGPNFPSYLWTMLRPHFVTDKAGTHVFAGLVDNANIADAPGGRLTISVNGKNQSGYFSMGKVNFSPALDNFISPIYDPITPFDVEFDKVTGKARGRGTEIPKLLPENEQMLKDGITKFTSGPNKGEKATQKNFHGQDMELQPFNQFTQQIYYPPHGLKYRWKEGIGSITQSTTSYQPNSNLARQSIPKTTQDAFAGQDIMNVLSMLICGQPYNFATFYKNAIGLGQIDGDFFNQPSYYRNLLNDLKKNNLMYGQFEPFKNLTIPEAAAALVGAQTDIIGQSAELEGLLRQRAELFDKYVLIGGKNEGLLGAESLKLRLDELDKKIALKQGPLIEAINSNHDTIVINGDDVSYDTDPILNPNGKRIDLTRHSEQRRMLRRKLNFLTRRMMYRVKSHDDQNLLIIDDSYDKDLDLQAFSQALIGSQLQLFNNDYQSVDQKIETVAALLDLEVFCDSQGHIQIRPPQYNKVPSSVFYKMIMNKQSTGIKVYPQYIEDLFKNQATTALSNLAIIEDEIRYRASLLGKIDDVKAAEVISNGFKFISNELTGEITDIKKIFAEENPDNLKVKIDNINNLANDLESQARHSGQVFTINDRAALLTDDAIASFTTTFLSAPNEQLRNRIDTVKNNLFKKTGIKPKNIEKFFEGTANLANQPGGFQSLSSLDAFKITKDISELVASRQRIIKDAAASIRNVEQAISFNDEFSESQDLLFPGFFTKKEGIPDILENMVEDESYDDYGPGSGRRYVINRKHILSFNYAESSPEFNMVEVNGMYGGGLADPPPDFNTGGGNGLFSAYAVDYDLWKLYGFRSASPVNTPFFSEPESQCAPFAVALLNRARGRILKGNVTVVGNEYHQVGEVVYIEHVNLLFYVESVSHSFTYGSNFQTTLTLTHGHTPGTYIPTAFDVIGKVLYKNRDQCNHVVIKNGNINETPLGVIGYASNSTKSEPNEVLASVEENIKILSNIPTMTLGVLSQKTAEEPSTIIEIRLYHTNAFGISSILQETADKIKTILRSGYYPEDAKALGAGTSSYKKGLPISNEKALQIVTVNLSETSDSRSPSPKAWAFAELQAEKQGSDSFLARRPKVEKFLVENVIDIWLVNK